MRPVLHVTNGDAPMPDIAAAAGVPADDVLPWRDVLHDGPVPAGLGPSELARVRARHLAANGWVSEVEAVAMLDARDARLAAHGAEAEIVLWFEEDLFDDLQLAQIADRLAGRPGPVTLVRLPHGPRDGLAAAFVARTPFTPDPAAFAALRAPDPRGWAEHGRMARLLEELPDSRTGLSRLEREILEALAAGPLTPADLFHTVAAREQPPWLGDTAVFAAADRLAPLVATSDGAREPATDGAATEGTYELTADGAAVLAGHATRRPHDHWIGGVHLAPGHPRWTYDAAAGEARALT